MQSLMAQAQKMQRQLQTKMAELANQEFEATKGGGVKVVLYGDRSVVEIDINEDLLEKENKEMVETMLILAFNECLEKLKRQKRRLTLKLPEAYQEVFNMEKLRSIEELIDALKRLPSIGSKSAERMAFALLNFQQDDLDDLANKISSIKKKVHPCPICGLYTENAICSICNDPERTDELIIVVAKPNDIIGFEQLANFHGRYHVLGGLLELLL